MTRRAFVAGFLLLVAGWLGCRRDSDPAANGDPLAAALLATLADPDAAARVGAAYLAQQPDEADAAGLATRLGAGWPEAALTADRAELSARLARQHRDDLVAGRHLRIDGWVVSETEMRLAALAALSR